MNIVEEPELHEDQVGGVWCVGSVEARSPLGLNVGSSLKPRIRLWNKFEALSENCAEDEGAHEPTILEQRTHAHVVQQTFRGQPERRASPRSASAKHPNIFIGGVADGPGTGLKLARVAPGSVGAGGAQEAGKDSETSVGRASNYRTIGRGLITIDSGAEESCWPEKLLPEFQTTQVATTRNFVAANGAPMKHYGEKLVKFRGGQNGIASMRFQVSDVTKPLASVARIMEQGNIVQIGPGAQNPD